MTPDQSEHLIQALLYTLPAILFFAFVQVGVGIVLPKETKRG